MLTHAHTHTHEHGRTDTQTHKRTHADTHACTHARTHARTHVCTHRRTGGQTDALYTRYTLDARSPRHVTYMDESWQTNDTGGVGQGDHGMGSRMPWHVARLPPPPPLPVLLSTLSLLQLVVSMQFLGHTAVFVCISWRHTTVPLPVPAMYVLD